MPLIFGIAKKKIRSIYPAANVFSKFYQSEEFSKDLDISTLESFLVLKVVSTSINATEIGEIDTYSIAGIEQFYKFKVEATGGNTEFGNATFTAKSSSQNFYVCYGIGTTTLEFLQESGVVKTPQPKIEVLITYSNYAENCCDVTLSFSANNYVYGKINPYTSVTTLGEDGLNLSIDYGVLRSFYSEYFFGDAYTVPYQLEYPLEFSEIIHFGKFSEYNYYKVPIGWGHTFSIEDANVNYSIHSDKLVINKYLADEYSNSAPVFQANTQGVEVPYQHNIDASCVDLQSLSHSAHFNRRSIFIGWRVSAWGDEVYNDVCNTIDDSITGATICTYNLLEWDSCNLNLNKIENTYGSVNTTNIEYHANNYYQSDEPYNFSFDTMSGDTQHVIHPRCEYLVESSEIPSFKTVESSTFDPNSQQFSIYYVDTHQTCVEYTFRVEEGIYLRLCDSTPCISIVEFCKNLDSTKSIHNANFLQYALYFIPSAYQKNEASALDVQSVATGLDLATLSVSPHLIIASNSTSYQDCVQPTAIFQEYYLAQTYVTLKNNGDTWEHAVAEADINLQHTYVDFVTTTSFAANDIGAGINLY